MAENEFVVSMEDISARKVGKGVDNSSQPSGNHEKLSTLIQEKLDKLLMEEDEQGGNPATLQKPKIQCVPYDMLRGQNNFEKYFEPRAFSIGLHHYYPHKEDEYKHKLAKRFIKERSTSTSTDGGKDLYMKIWNNIEKLIDCYDVNVSKYRDNERLAWMFFLDGCSTLQFIQSLVSMEYNEEVNEFNFGNDQIAFAQVDLFLLENQLPYQLLKLLMNDDNPNDEKFINMNRYKQSLLMFMFSNTVVPPPYNNGYKLLLFNFESKLKEEPAHLLQLLHMSLVQQPTSKEIKSNPHNHYWLIKSYRSAKQLNNVGITFKPNKSGTFTDVAFATRFLLFGELTLAPLLVDDRTKYILLNLVAFETTSGGPRGDFWVTSYICFINSLLHDAEDVKVLTSHDILLNYLGNEQQVVDLFHDISNNLIPNPRAYRRVSAGIEKHFRRKVKLLIAEWLHAHFSNTWALLAFLAAIFAIALTLIQTYFAAYPPNKG